MYKEISNAQWFRTNAPESLVGGLDDTGKSLGLDLRRRHTCQLSPGSYASLRLT